MSKRKKQQSDYNDLLRNICDKANYCLSHIYSGINKDRYFIELLTYYINEYNSFKVDKSTIPNLINRIQNIIDFESDNPEFNTNLTNYVNFLSSKSVFTADAEQINKYHDYIESYRKNNPCDMIQLKVFIDILSKNSMVTNTINDIKDLWTQNDDEISYLLKATKNGDMRRSKKLIRKIFNLNFPVEIYTILLLSYIDEVKYGNNKSLYYLNDNDNTILFNSELDQFTKLDTLIIQLNKILGIETC